MSFLASTEETILRETEMLALTGFRLVGEGPFKIPMIGKLHITKHCNKKNDFKASIHTKPLRNRYPNPSHSTAPTI